MTHTLTETEQQKISAFLFYSGHANPRFVGKFVIYRDQTRGLLAQDRMIEYQPILEFVKDKSLVQIDKAIFNAAMHQTRDEFAVAELAGWKNDIPTILELSKLPPVWDIFYLPTLELELD